MSNRVTHRNAGDLRPGDIGQHVTITTLGGGTITGGLSDYSVGVDTVILWFGGHTVTAYPTTKVTLGRLDVMGGAQ